MNKWIAVFDLEDGDTMPEHMDLNYMGAMIDFHCRPMWIPVAKRLPDIKEHNVSDTCIVYCENGSYGFAELEENIFGQAVWNCERDDEYHEPLGKVVAWMPLPEPYKKEEEEK